MERLSTELSHLGYYHESIFIHIKDIVLDKNADYLDTHLEVGM